MAEGLHLEGTVELANVEDAVLVAVRCRITEVCEEPEINTRLAVESLKAERVVADRETRAELDARCGHREVSVETGILIDIDDGLEYIAEIETESEMEVRDRFFQGKLRRDSQLERRVLDESEPLLEIEVVDVEVEIVLTRVELEWKVEVEVESRILVAHRDQISTPIERQEAEILVELLVELLAELVEITYGLPHRANRVAHSGREAHHLVAEHVGHADAENRDLVVKCSVANDERIELLARAPRFAIDQRDGSRTAHTIRLDADIALVKLLDELPGTRHVDLEIETVVAAN